MGDGHGHGDLPVPQVFVEGRGLISEDEVEGIPRVGGCYILGGRTPILINDLTCWARWMSASARVIALSHLDGVQVSTVFTGLDHRIDGNGPALLFESIVTGGGIDGVTDRYSTWSEAEAGHMRIVKSLK